MILKCTRVIHFLSFVLILCLFFTTLLSSVNALAYANVTNSLTTEELAQPLGNQVIRVRVGNPPSYHFGDTSPRIISTEFLNLIVKKTGLKLKYLSNRMSRAEVLVKINESLDAITPEERSAINHNDFAVERTQSMDDNLLRGLLLITAIILFFTLAWNTLLRRKVVQRSSDLEKELERRRTSEAQYRQLINSFGNDFILFTLNSKGLLTYISPSASDMLGFAPKDIINHHYSNLHNDSPVSEQAIANTEAGLRGEQLPSFETEFIHKDGRIVTAEATERPIFDEQGQVIALEGVLHNITEHKQVEQELKQHQEQLEELVSKRTDQLRTLSSAVEQSHSTIVITDLEGKIEYVNPAFSRATGYTAEEALGKKNICKLNSSHQNADFFQELWNTLSAGKVWQGEMCNKRKDGSLYWELANISPVRDKNGHITHYVAVKEDITARKKVDLALEESRKQLTHTLEAANLGSWDWRPQSNKLFTNDIFYTMLGYTDDSRIPLTLKRWSALVHPDDLEQTLAMLQSHVDGNDDYYRSEHRLLGADGQWKWILDVGRVITRDSNGNALRFVGVHVDISEQKQIETLLIDAQQQSELANKHKSQFLANMSHEIRTPMNALIGLSELALDTELTLQQNDYLSKINSSSQGLLSIINDILDYSTIESGHITLKKVAFPLSQIIHEVEELFINQASQKGLKLQFIIDSTIPATLHGDAPRIRQVLINLVGNALKFTNHGTIGIMVSLLSQVGKHVNLKFSVLDSGIGIPADKLSMLFKPFSQVDASYTRQYGGTGLGLAISKQFIKMMGGKLTVQSDEGKGSEFSFILSLEKTDKKCVPRHTLHYSQAKETHRDIRMTQDISILLVEDNEINNLVATKMLAKINCQVKAVNNGEEAIAAYKSSLRENTPFSLILMDIQMPILDGYTATTQIREWEASHTDSAVHVPIIAMTAHAMAADRAKCSAVGMDDFISKPLNKSDLFETLSNFIAIKVMGKAHSSKLLVSSVAEQTAEKIELRDTLPGIHLEKGIARLEGNSELYLLLLKDFISQFHENGAEIEKLLEQNKQDNARQIIHTVKGVAGNLCTYKVLDAAVLLETALLEGNSVNNILNRYSFAWQELTESVESLENNLTSLTQEEIPPPPPSNKEIASRLYSNLLRLLDSMDFQATTGWQELRPFFHQNIDAEKITEIDRCIAILDFKNARKLLKCFDKENFIADI